MRPESNIEIGVEHLRKGFGTCQTEYLRLLGHWYGHLAGK
jgi:hypothetical protein